MKDIEPINLFESFDEYRDDFEAVQKYCMEVYDANFKCAFSGVRELDNRFKDKHVPMTDKDLETVLTEVPLALFEVSEALNSLRLNKEVVKLKLKSKKMELEKALTEDGISKSEAQRSASYSTTSDEILLIVLSSIISRAESEMSYCKEFIMGCKKVWDGRKSNTMPVGEIDSKSSTLPDYRFEGKEYVG